MDIKIYHGSEHIVRKPVFGTGNAYNDFGLGFYCSENARNAAAWAVSRDRNGFVSAYSINPDRLRVINLCSSTYTPLHWLSVLFNFREFDFSSASAHRAREYINSNFSVDFQGTDCIIGYRADDVCFKFAQDFIDGNMSYQSMKYYLTVCHEMNITRAAKKLYLTQQTLSEHISRLEKEYGVKLFTREPQLQLTYAGEQMRILAERVMAQSSPVATTCSVPSA